jgi:homoserine O-acetyltransferase
VFSVKDVVRAFGLVRAHLGIQRIYLGIGASMGGQHLLQWAVDEPGLFEHIIPIACNARQSAWALAIDAAQRMAIEADATWPQADEQAGTNGMKAARALALVHYRSYQSFAGKNHNAAAAQDAETYLRYQALRLAERFNAFSYYNLSLQRRTYDLSAGYGSAEAALQRITARCLVLGIANDGLFPLAEQAFLAAHIPSARLEVIESIYGHDAFLVEYEQLTRHISAFLAAPALPVAPPAVP